MENYPSKVDKVYLRENKKTVLVFFLVIERLQLNVVEINYLYLLLLFWRFVKVLTSSCELSANSGRIN